MVQQVLYVVASGEILQWQDTAAFNFPANPAGTATLPVTAAEWATLDTAQHVAAGALAAGAVIPALTLAQQAQAAFGAGLAITSTGTPALSATYPVDATTQAHISAEMIALLNSSGTAFADNSASVVWPDIEGLDHTFTIAEFKPFALAIGAYVAALFKVLNGTLAAMPAATATIA